MLVGLETANYRMRVIIAATKAVEPEKELDHVVQEALLGLSPQVSDIVPDQQFCHFLLFIGSGDGVIRVYLLDQEIPEYLPDRRNVIDR